MMNYDPNAGRRPRLGGISARYFLDDLFGGGGNEITQQSTLTGGQEDLLNQLTKLLSGELGQGGDVFQGRRVAGLSPLQQQAFGAAGGAIPLAQQAFGFGTELPEALGQAQDQLTRTLQPFDPESTISNFAPARDAAVRNFENVTVPSIMERFAGANAVSSSAAPQAVANAGRDLSLGLSSQLGQLLNQGEQSQLNRQQQGIGQALQVAGAPLALTQQAGQAGLGLLGQAAGFGSQQRSFEQQGLNAEMAKFQEGQPGNNQLLNLLSLALGTPAFENIAQQGGAGLGGILGPALGGFLSSEAGAGALAGGAAGLGGLFAGGGSAAGVGSAALLSDSRFKENIKEIDSPLDKIAKLNGYSYNYKFNSTDDRNGGVMAQELEKVLPDAVGDIEGIKYVRYDAVVALLVEAVNELNEKIN